MQKTSWQNVWSQKEHYCKFHKSCLNPFRSKDGCQEENLAELNLVVKHVATVYGTYLDVFRFSENIQQIAI